MRLAEPPSRRDLLTGRMGRAAPAEVHISSLVVNVRPEKVDAVRVGLAALAGVEIHAEAPGKLVLTLETDSEAEIVDRLNRISFLDGVLSAALVFHHHERAADGGPAANQG